MAHQAKRQIKTTIPGGFKNIWLQDSTTVQLPETLFERYRGGVRHKPYSIAKLNVVVDLLSGVCPVMEWSEFTVTEQALSPRIFTIAQAGDLVLRDLGYFVLKVFRQMNEKGIYFLSRWRYGVALFDEKDGKTLDLAALLRGKERLDINVLCGAKEQVPMRLVAVKIKDEQAAERIRKARKDRHRNTKHSNHYYSLLGYIIFLTNVNAQTWSCKQVADVYRLRWNVEMLFKSWKTSLRLQDFIPEAKTLTLRVESWLYLLLLYFSWFQLILYYPLRLGTFNLLSIIQIAKWAIGNITRWLMYGLKPAMVKEIIYYCSYDTRRRSNAAQGLAEFLRPLS